MTNYVHFMGVVSSNKMVRGVAPFVMGQIWLESQPDSGDVRGAAPWVRGVDPRWESNVSVLPKSVTEGRFDLAGNGILIGCVLARSLRVTVGDHVAIYSPPQLQRMRQSRQANKDEVDLAGDFEVRGIFDVGYNEYNASLVVLSLPNAQALYELNDSVRGLILMLHDANAVETVRDQLRSILGPDYDITTWTDENSVMLNALLVEKNVMFYILFFIMIVAAFGIASALITFVVQKTREIGMLKALGATSRQVMLLFLSQSIIVGVLGVISGFGLGMLALAYRNEFLNFMNRMTGFELFPASIYSFSELPAMIVPSDIAIICGGSLLICLLAGVIPAWNAGRLKPVEALRYE